ncbi:MAG: MBL fold metallo-hydrolase, partial [Candidatus Acidiferrales bacterium]
MIKRSAIRFLLAAAGAAMLFTMPIRGGAQASAPARKPKAPRSVRLYVFDCGVLHNPDMGRFNLKKEDVPTSDMSMACFLIAHPKGNLIWDTGAVPDGSWTPNGRMIAQQITLPDGSTRDADVDKSLRGQLAEIGYAPSDIKYLALSHYHYDHTGNANEFAGAIWLVPRKEHDVMFGSGK